MENQQPEALRLADLIASDFDPDWMAEEGYDQIAAELRRLHEVEGRYHELLYAVSNAYAGESRHQTALRYIQQSEMCDSAAAKEMK